MKDLLCKMKDLLGDLLMTWPTVFCTLIMYTNYGMRAAIITFLVILFILASYLIGQALTDKDE